MTIPPPPTASGLYSFKDLKSCISTSMKGKHMLFFILIVVIKGRKTETRISKASPRFVESWQHSYDINLDL